MRSSARRYACFTSAAAAHAGISEIVLAAIGPFFACPLSADNLAKAAIAAPGPANVHYRPNSGRSHRCRVRPIAGVPGMRQHGGHVRLVRLASAPAEQGLMDTDSHVLSVVRASRSLGEARLTYGSKRPNCSHCGRSERRREADLGRYCGLVASFYVFSRRQATCVDANDATPLGLKQYR